MIVLQVQLFPRVYILTGLKLLEEGLCKDHHPPMVYISSWQEYQEAAEALYLKSPNKVSICIALGTSDYLNLCIRCQARYCVKWKPSDGKLVLKITDDTTVRIYILSYRTNDSLR